MILGIDYDTYKATIVGIRLTPAALGFPVEIEECRYRKKGLTGDTESRLALQQVLPALRESALIRKADAIAVERGAGMNRKGEWEMGAFFGAITTAITALRPDVSLTWVEAREWKREVTALAGWREGQGNANAKKPEAHQALASITPLMGLGTFGVDDLARLSLDEKDALAIAWTYRRMNERAVSVLR